MRAESMALNDQLQVAAVQKEKYGTKDGALAGVHHTPWSRVMRKKIRFARAVAGLTGRIVTIVVLIPRSDRRSPVDTEEYHDRPCRRPPIGPAKQGQTHLLRRLQEECPSRPSAQQSPLSGELDTPTGILVADRLS